MKTSIAFAFIVGGLLPGIGASAEQAPGQDAAAEQATSRYEWGKHTDEHIMKGDLVVEAQDGTRKVAKVLGLPLGSEVIDGVEVGLYILQATNPARLAPGAIGPTHLINVSFVPADGGRMISQVMGAVVVEGDKGQVMRWPLHPDFSHQQAEGRLEDIGEYRFSVEYVLADGKGKTAAYPFLYERKPGPYRHNHGSGHEGHGGGQDDHADHDQMEDHSQHH